jgi:hypothetical protein
VANKVIKSSLFNNFFRNWWWLYNFIFGVSSRETGDYYPILFFVSFWGGKIN